MVGTTCMPCLKQLLVLALPPAPKIDSRDPDPQFYHPGRPDRLWLRRLLQGIEYAAAGGEAAAGAAAAAQAAAAPAATGAPGIAEDWGALAADDSSGSGGSAYGGSAETAWDRGPAGEVGPWPSGKQGDAAITQQQQQQHQRQHQQHQAQQQHLFTDTFRSFHPRRLCAYTVWNTSTNARCVAGGCWAEG
jgi:hypothetical protein